jgi:hypothetical protein
MKATFLVALFLLVGEICFAQLSTLADAFPLEVGNKWTYSFSNNRAGDGWKYLQEDKGIAVYQIVASRVSVDSTLWLIIRQRDFTQYDWYSGMLQSTASMHDSVSFEIVELPSGAHELYVPINDENSDVFPFWRLWQDTTRFHRYIPIDTTGIASVNNLYPFLPNTLRNLTFQRNMGVTSSSGYKLWGGASGSVHWNYVLQSNIVNGDDDVRNARPAQFSLSQNYPNPFNSSTIIRFDVPVTSFVTLGVFDLLGKEVAVLVNEEVKAGGHERTFDGRGLASGVYLYRIQAGSVVQTKKLILLR